MSVFGDFQEVWLERFPDSELPSAWEEDVRANLDKHKQKVDSLKEELGKEELYVEYLKRLLSDIEGHKKKVEKKTEEICIGEENSLSKENEVNIEPSAPPCESPQCENAVNKCISELSAVLTTKTTQATNNEETESDISNNVVASSFVTVIEVNGLKNNPLSTAPSKQQPPPLPPAKPKLLPGSRGSLAKSNSIESVKSSHEQLTPIDEPYYDLVALDYEESSLLKSEASSTENVFSNSSTLPLHMKHASLQSQQSVEPPSPEPQINYVNIEYFINKNLELSDDEDDNDEGIQLRKNNDSGSYASSSSLECSTPATRRKYSQNSTNESEKVDGEKSSIYKSILLNIIDSESNYVEWLQVLLSYMKAIKATLGSSQPVITEQEFKTIFYKIPELHLLHSNFLESMKKHSKKWDTRVGDSFKIMAENLELYGAFLSNYGRAVDTAKRCSNANSQLCEVFKNITCKHLSGQPISLEDLLHKPVARVQKNALVLHDLVKATPTAHQDHHSLASALSLTQKFLDQFNMIQTKSMFPATDRAQRRLVKNSFIVEYVDGNRKLRHLFLFNDVIACAKYKVSAQSSGRSDKYTFELKWFIPVEDIFILEESMANPHEIPSTEIVNLKSQASNARDQIRLDEKAADDKKSKVGRGSEKVRKRLRDLESELVLVSPNLMFRIRHRQLPKQYTFFLSSEFERTQWIETIHTLQATSRPPAPNSTFSMLELQTWITACRTYLKTNMGSYLLRSGHDESLLVGDLHLTLYNMHGLEYAADLFICIEVDFYGHFFRKARSKIVYKSSSPEWNESFVLDLEGCENLRILVYRESGSSHVALFGKHTQQLSRLWLQPEQIEKKLHINGCELRIGLKFIPFEVSQRRVPGKGGPLFGEKIAQICKIHQHENENKMSLHNLATVFGPTLMRPSVKGDGKAKIHLATETVDVMAQAGILYCFLQDKNSHFRKEY